MKKRLSIILTVLVSIVILSLSASAYAMGDVDGNGKISAMDARMALRAAAHIETLSEEAAAAADVDGNGKISAMDARTILRVASRLDVFDTPVAPPTTEPVAPPTTEPVAPPTTEPVAPPTTEPVAPPTTEPVAPPTTEPTTANPSLSAKEIHNMALKYTVQVYAISDTSISAGSGFFISTDGQVVTNFHVIEGTYEIYIIDCNGDTYYVSDILAYHAEMDIAILKTDATSVPAVLNKNQVETGDTIYTLGNSTGEYIDTFTNGIISNASRVVESYNPTMEYIQMTAPITHGNSGGPLINEKGEVIGINTWGDTSGQNLNFSIPVKYLDELDMNYPITIEEFAVIGGYFPPSDEPEYPPEENPGGTTGYIESAYSSIALQKGGSACILLSFENCTGDITPVCYYDGSYVEIEWGEWYGDITVLFVTGLNYTSYTTLEIYVEENEDISLEIPVSVSYSGSDTYLGEDYAYPDFGAYTGISPYYMSMNDSVTLTAYSYDLDALIDAGLTSDELVTGFTNIMESYGFSFAYSDETSERYTLIYDSIYYEDVSMSYSLLYDYGTPYAIMIGLHY